MPTITARVCERITEVLDKRIEQYQESKAKRKDVVLRIENLIVLAQSKGVDTAELEAALPGLKQRVELLTSDIETLISVLEEAKQADCNATDGKFDNVLKDAREELLAIRNDLKEIKKYYDDTISPLLKTIKTELKKTVSPTGTR